MQEKHNVMIVGVKYNGQMLSVAPGSDQVEFRDYDQPRAWERVELTETPERRIHARFLAADRVLSIAGGRLETRPAGTIGPWETFIGGVMPSGESALMRADAPVNADAAVVLEVVEAQ